MARSYPFLVALSFVLYGINRGAGSGLAGLPGLADDLFRSGVLPDQGPQARHKVADVRFRRVETSYHSDLVLGLIPERDRKGPDRSSQGVRWHSGKDGVRFYRVVDLNARYGPQAPLEQRSHRIRLACTRHPDVAGQQRPELHRDVPHL